MTYCYHHSYYTCISYLSVWCTVLVLLCGDVDSKRNYRHSEQELSLTRVVVMGGRKCAANEVPIVIHSAAHSEGKYFDRRQLSRNTWVKEAKAHHMRPLFMIGLPTSADTQKQLETEAKEHNDIIQFGFVDNYYNLTLKALSALRWITRNCLSSDYILKCDDDVIVNIPLLDTMFKGKEFSNGLTGKMLITRSNRFVGHKWFMPQDVYRHSFYQFLYGFSYIMSKTSAKKMYKTSANFSGPVLDIDDLFMTGVLAQKARVRIYNDKRFDYFCQPNACPFSQMIAVHGCDSVNQTLYIWNEWKRSKDKECWNRRNDFEFNLDLFDFKLSFNFNLPDFQTSPFETSTKSDYNED